MKKSKILAMALIGALLTFIGFYSCEKTYVEPISPTTMERPTLVIAPGGWRISSFQWHDRSDNPTFLNYTFTFNTDGSVTALHSNIREYGRWSRGHSTLRIAFERDPLNELNNVWTIVTHTENSAELRGLSPIDNSSEFLLLSKLGITALDK